MNISKPLRELGDVEVDGLRESLLAQEPDAWREFELRQQSYDVHTYTESIVLVFCDGQWPELVVTKHPGWDRVADLAVPLMHGIIDAHYPKGGTIIRAMAAKLLAGGRIAPHFDSHPSFRYGHRIHVPITTSRHVRFMIDGRPYQFEVGKAYEINNQLTHSVMNRGKEDRITFIFDYVPPTAVQSVTDAASEPPAAPR